MALLQRLMFAAARRIAADPRTKAKAKQVFETEIKPRAADALAKAKPKIAKAKESVRAELDDIAKDTDPRREPARFAGRLARRLIDKAKGRE